MYRSAYESFYNYARREGFAASGGDGLLSSALALAMIALFIFVQLFIVKWLWNTVLVRVVTVAKPIPNVLHTLGLLVLLGLLFPC